MIKVSLLSMLTPTETTCVNREDVWTIRSGSHKPRFLNTETQTFISFQLHIRMLPAAVLPRPAAAQVLPSTHLINPYPAWQVPQAVAAFCCDFCSSRSSQLAKTMDAKCASTVLVDACAHISHQH